MFISPDSRPTTRPYELVSFRIRLGKNLTAVALGFSSGSSEYSSPVYLSGPSPIQTLTDFYFSLDAVAKNASSCDQLMPQIILE